MRDPPRRSPVLDRTSGRTLARAPTARIVWSRATIGSQPMPQTSSSSDSRPTPGRRGGATFCWATPEHSPHSIRPISRCCTEPWARPIQRESRSCSRCSRCPERGGSRTTAILTTRACRGIRCRPPRPRRHAVSQRCRHVTRYAPVALGVLCVSPGRFVKRHGLRTRNGLAGGRLQGMRSRRAGTRKHRATNPLWNVLARELTPAPQR